MGTTDHGRDSSFGRSGTSVVDRFGVWLSDRQVRRQVTSFAGLRVADLGCGFRAAILTRLLEDVASATVVDVDLADELIAHPKVTAIRGLLPEAVGPLPDSSFDVIMCTSVLEHLWDDDELLRQCHRLLAPGGTLLVNVPSWTGKRFLELAAFRFGVSPREEMEDHKRYYDPRDLWPGLVAAGFLPSRIKCFKHKGGLNTFAACRKSLDADRSTTP